VLPSASEPWSIVVTGIGGTGVVTVGALIGMAAHLEGKGAGVLDMAGLAQKNGAVTSHLRIADDPKDIQAVRVEPGGADAVIGCDIVVTGGEKVLALFRQGRTKAVVNTHGTMTADFTSKPDLKLPTDLLELAIKARVGDARADFIDAGTLATRILGDAIAQNLFLTGYAYQRGLLPVSASAIEEAIRINAVAVDMNTRAFRWGRRAALDFAAVHDAAFGGEAADEERAPETLDELVDRRARFLTAYQNAAWADRYRALVAAAREAEGRAAPGKTDFAEAVARSAFKLMASKDEYEVARLFTDGSFAAQVAAEFEGDYRLEYHLAPPLLATVDPVTGVPRKRAYGAWMRTAFGVLAGLKGLRGTAFDPFGYGAERKMERRLIDEFEGTVRMLAAELAPATHAVAVEIAGLPMTMRGFGHIKAKAVAEAKAREAELLARLRTPAPTETRAVA